MSSPKSEAKTVNVRVQYAAAVKPYHEHLDPQTTIGALKALVLTTFGLHDGAAVDGGTATYDLIYNRAKLTDPGATLSQVLGGHPEVQMSLAQVLTQG